MTQLSGPPIEAARDVTDLHFDDTMDTQANKSIYDAVAERPMLTLLRDHSLIHVQQNR